jgi:Zn-dependent protease
MEPRAGMLYAACVAVSVLAHEFGHALVAKLFRLNPQILLTGFGGLTGHERAQRDRDDALIIAAGPLAGLLLGSLALAARLWLPMPAPLREMAANLVEINFFLSGLNALPLWPLDGGQLYRLGMLKLAKPAQADRIVHISALILLAGLLYYIGTDSPFTMMIALVIGMQNITALQNGTNGAPVRAVNRHAVELFRNAVLAYERGDDAEAARLCHQLRAESNVPAEIVKRTWALLGITTTRKGDFEEALSYLRRAPDSPEVVEATAQCFYQLEMYEALEALVQTKAFERLPGETRDAIVKALVDGKAACTHCDSRAG